MEVVIKGKTLTRPQDRVMVVEATAKAVCQEVGEDPAEAIMMLLTAAAHLYAQYSRDQTPHSTDGLATALSYAIVAADSFFRLKDISQPTTEGADNA